MDGKTMHIAAAANKKFLRYLYVMLTSLFENNPGEEIRLYILSTEFDSEDKAVLCELAEKYGAAAVFPDIPVDRYEMSFPTNSRISIETYYRLLLPDIIPRDVDRVLYLDSDLIVHGPIQELYDADFDGKPLAGCYDTLAVVNGHLDSCPLFVDIKDEEDFTYVNAGVLLFNLEDLRRRISVDELLKNVAKISEHLRYHDQDFINSFFRGEIKLLNMERFNLTARTAWNSGVRCDFVEEQNVILHYAGPKPWDPDQVHYELERFFWDYAKLTPFYTELLEDIVLYEVNESFYDKTFRELRAENDDLRKVNDHCMQLVRKLQAQTELPRTPCGRLVLFVGVNDMLDLITYELRDEFVRIGYEIMLFDTGAMEQSLARLGGFIKKPVTAAITVNNLGYNMELIPGQNTWDGLGITIVNYLIDHPYGHKAAIDASPKNAVVLTVDKNHLKYLSRFYPQIPVTGFLPHGGKSPEGDIKPIKDRDIDFIYAGGLSYDYGKRRMPDFEAFGFDAKAAADRAMEIMYEDNSVTTEDAIERALLEMDVRLPDIELCDVIEKLHYIDCFVVSHYREALIRELVENGFRVTVYGDGWQESDLMSHENFDHRGHITAYDVIGKMQEAKVVLSLAPWFKEGAHDRIFNGMLAGAVVVAESTGYLREEFDDDDMIMFELDSIQGLGDRMRALFDDTDKMQKMADRGRKKAEQKHTWAHRARELHEDLLSHM